MSIKKMSLTKISLVSLLVVVKLVSYSHCWAFTDIKMNTLRSAIDPDDLDATGNELSEDDESELRINLIYPGTKWCGTGNVADDYDDLGSARETDMCCRTHDNCPDVISAGETKNNLTNEAFYSRLSCDCDLAFRQCLHSANTSTSRHIGQIYFNLLGTKCYRQDYPVTGCQRHGGWLNQKCLEPTYDTEGEQIYQWFDVPNY